MKTLLKFILVLLASSAFAATQTPINNGRLVTDLNANGQSITNAGSVVGTNGRFTNLFLMGVAIPLPSANGSNWALLPTNYVPIWAASATNAGYATNAGTATNGWPVQWPWEAITNAPAHYAPSAHNQALSTITNAGTAAAASVADFQPASANLTNWSMLSTDVLDTGIGTNLSGITVYGPITALPTSLADLVVNGNCSTSYAGWPYTEANTYYIPGGQSGIHLALGGGYTYQSLSTVVGREYEVIVWHKSMAQDGAFWLGPSTNRIYAFYDSMLLTDAGWTIHTATFTATNVTTWLTLFCGGPSPSQVTGFDTISVIPTSSSASDIYASGKVYATNGFIGAIGSTNVTATGSPSATTFLRGDYSWATPLVAEGSYQGASAVLTNWSSIQPTSKQDTNANLSGWALLSTNDVPGFAKAGLTTNFYSTTRLAFNYVNGVLTNVEALQGIGPVYQAGSETLSNVVMGTHVIPQATHATNADTAAAGWPTQWPVAAITNLPAYQLASGPLTNWSGVDTNAYVPAWAQRATNANTAAAGWPTSWPWLALTNVPSGITNDGNATNFWGTLSQTNFDFVVATNGASVSPQTNLIVRHLGSEAALIVDTNALVVTDGNVGIGTTVPDQSLQVAGGVAFDYLPARFNAYIAGKGYGIIYQGNDGATYPFDANGNLIIQPRATTNGRDIVFAGAGGGSATITAKMVIQGNNGNVGIGTTAPDRKLEINSATGANLRLTYNDSDGSAVNYVDMGVDSGGNGSITNSGGTLTVRTNIIALGSITATNGFVGSIGSTNITATGTPSATTYLRGDYSWATPSGGATVTLLDCTAAEQTAILTNSTTRVANVFIKSNATYNAFIVVNGTTNTITGSLTWVDAQPIGTTSNWVVRW